MVQKYHGKQKGGDHRLSNNTKKLLRIEELRLAIYKDYFDVNDDYIIRVGKFWRGTRCPKCNRWTTRRHQRGRLQKILHHLDISGRRVYLLLRKDRYTCCGTFTENYPFIAKHLRMSNLACSQLLKQLKRKSFSYVEKEYGISYRTAVKLLTTGQFTYNWEKSSYLSIGLDGHSFAGREMVTTVTNLTTMQVIGIIPGESKARIVKFLKQIPVPVTEVCIDMDNVLRSAVITALPNTQIVVDHFHIIQDANNRIDKARRLEQELRNVNIPKKIWLTNKENLDYQGLSKLKHLKQTYPILEEFHWVKERLRKIYRQAYKKEARQELVSLIRVMERSDNVEVNLWSRTLYHWRKEILAYYNHRTTNAYTEGVHTKMKLIKRVSFGFKKVEVYIRKVLLAFIPLSIAYPYHT